MLYRATSCGGTTTRGSTRQALHLKNNLADFSEADNVRAWIDKLKRDVARQSERLIVLEQENNDMTRTLADYEYYFDALVRESRERKRLRKRSSETEGKAEEDRMTKKRKIVQCT